MPVEVKSMKEWEESGTSHMLSILIPAHNEEEQIAGTVRHLASAVKEAGIPFEILVVNDNSVDRTENVLRDITAEIPELRYVYNPSPNGFGWAVRKGLAEFMGDTLAIVMADGSDDPRDVVAFYRKIEEGYDCVFGSRFSRGGRCYGYPLPKLILNRLANRLIQLLFWIPCDDITNAFKMYRRGVIARLYPLLSQHFNLTIELPLKSITRGCKYAVLPNKWYNRKTGQSKWVIKEMGSRYIFTLLYCLLEKILLPHDAMLLAQLSEERLQVWPK